MLQRNPPSVIPNLHKGVVHALKGSLIVDTGLAVPRYLAEFTPFLI